jgi:hypothetical protein
MPTLSIKITRSIKITGGKVAHLKEKAEITVFASPQSSSN